ncbi:hypothetical protein KA012_01870 [Candidatus Woesebacteria bacterium]|nr:hypothetical protein [Candidatus Woesebacteria bacterium]
MGALPKNKITRSERGRRRAGNTPKLAVDTNVIAIPLSKRGLASSILSKLGFSNEQVVRVVHKKRRVMQNNLTNLNERSAQTTQMAGNDSSKHRAQHKG